MKISKPRCHFLYFHYCKQKDNYPLDTWLYVNIQTGVIILFLLTFVIETLLNHYPQAKLLWVLGIVVPIISAEMVLRGVLRKWVVPATMVAYVLMAFLGIHYSGSILTPSILYTFLVIIIVSLLSKGILKYACILSVIIFADIYALREMHNLASGSLSKEIYEDWIAYFTLIALNVLWLISTISKTLRSYDMAFQQANAELYRIAVTDPLTEVYNKRYLNTYANDQLTEKSKQSSTVVLMIDIDYFKQYNDLYGHMEGDNCLKRVAAALKRALCRHTNLIFRIGGEEFLAILNGVDYEDLQGITDGIHNELANEKMAHTKSPAAPHITVSIGAVYCSTQADFDINEILQAADIAMYQAKQMGRHRTVIMTFARSRE